MSRKTAILLLFTVLGNSAFAETQERFDGDRALSYIQMLCQPEFEARKTGLPGGRKAAAWIASQFQSWRLQPGGGNGSFLQEFPMLVTQQTKVAKLKLKNGLFGSVAYQDGNDFNLYFNSGSGKLTAEVVFVGCGICAPEKGWDDYSGVDVHGKIVLISRSTPEDGQDWSKENERDYKMRVATEKGAAGLLMFSNGDWSLRGGTIHEEGYNPRLPAFNVSQKVARDLFRGTMKNLDYTLRDLAKKPMSFSTKKMVTVEAEVQGIEPGVGENAVAVLPGTDPALANEYIVVGGHMDHNGLSPDGHAYYGADDNASGTAVVMELARTFAARSDRPKRSILFVAFGGEEQGLDGSKYFADHPTVPGESICAMFNFDMAGCGDGGAGFSGRNYFPSTINALLASLSDSVTKKLHVNRGWGMGGSDHAHFIEQGIPAFAFHSTGDHPFYHQVEDTPETINPQSLQFVGDRAAELLQQLADTPKSLLFAGQRSGRCFLLFGDQIVLNPSAQQIMEMKNDLPRFVEAACAQGIRAVVLPVGRSMNGEGSLREVCRSTGEKEMEQEKEQEQEHEQEHEQVDAACQLYHAADSLSQWIKAQERYLLPSRNGGSLNEAASSGKLAVTMKLDGTFLLDGDIGLFRNLTKLGVGFLSIDNPADPIFSGDSLSAIGNEVLQVCKDENVLLDCAVQVTAFVGIIMKESAGRAIFRFNAEKAVQLADWVKRRVDKKRHLLVIECSPACRTEKLSAIMDSFDCERIYFSFSSSKGTGLNEENLAVSFSLLQGLYELRVAKGGKEQAYKEMVAVWGGNLKWLLERTN